MDFLYEIFMNILQLGYLLLVTSIILQYSIYLPMWLLYFSKIAQLETTKVSKPLGTWRNRGKVTRVTSLEFGSNMY